MPPVRVTDLGPFAPSVILRSMRKMPVDPEVGVLMLRLLFSTIGAYHQTVPGAKALLEVA